MSLYNKVIWSEGMFLRPHHFQQQDRYLESLIGKCASGLGAHGWGVSELEIDRDLLKTGKLALARCSGIMPDGTLFSLPDEADPPPPLELAEDIQNATVYLALALRDSRGMDIESQGLTNGLARYAAQESEVRDSSGTADGAVPIAVGRLRLRLMLEHEERAGYQCIGLARILQVGADKTVVFDEEFIPPCVTCTVGERLSGFVSELEGLLHQRAESLAGRVSESGRGGAAEIADFMMLQLVNRYEPTVGHLAKQPSYHPETLYRYLLGLAGELATFTAKEKRPPEFPEYRHEALKETFEPVFLSLRRSLSMVLERTAIAIPLEERKYNVRVAIIKDRSLLKDAVFVLAVTADVPAESLDRTFPAQIKIGPVEKIRELVNLALPGIAVRRLPVAPRQIPYHAGVTYFELDRKSQFWKGVQQSGGMAFHISGKFPGLDLAFWAIKQ